jgi:membrane-bound metal-dependent hydrolase YbcI (DUF457 family)
MATGPTHAMSGLAAWAAVTAFAHTPALEHLSMKTWAVGATLSAGAALLPDIDHPKSTVAGTFGGITRATSRAVSGFSGFLYGLTSTKHDSHRDGRHRGFTHTLVFGVLAGLITTAIVQTSQGAVLAVLMFFFAGLAVRGLLHTWSHHRDALLIALLSLILTVACWVWAGNQPTDAAAFGIAVVIGCVAHYLGDAITEHGCPIFWPVPLGGQTWFPVAPPKFMRMSTGGKVELALVAPALTISAVVLSAIVLYRIGAAPWVARLDLPPEILSWIPAGDR